MRHAVRPVLCGSLLACSKRQQHGHSSSAPEGSEAEASVSTSPQEGGPSQHAADEATTYRSLYPKVRLRATTQERPYRRSSFTTFQEPDTTNAEVAADAHENASARAAAGTSSSLLMSTESTITSTTTTDATTQSLTVTEDRHTTDAMSAPLAGNEVQQFLDEVQRQVDMARFKRNQNIPFPATPESNSPQFRRIKRHTKMTITVPDPDYPTFARKDQAVQLPPPQEHPWVRKNTPIGHFIVHGDGQINQTGGTGQVDFDDSPVDEKLPIAFRGLQHHSVLQRPLPQDNGRVVQEAVLKHSFTLTGRGLFATRKIAKGENIIIVQSTARNVGVKGELERLEEMCIDILIACRDGDVRTRAYFHDWILTGQPSALVEHWPAPGTARVMEAIGGQAVLEELELHPIHVARLAAILDLNSFLVESSYAERKGMAYFPEAGFLNHSCAPNASYDIMPEHSFRDSDYYLDEASASVEEDAEVEQGETHAKEDSSSIDGGGAPASDSAEVQKGMVEHEKSSISTRNSSSNSSTIAGNAAHFGSEDRLSLYPDLTEADAPVYLFCCRAEKDIEAGEEILISYVPPQWSFENRQYVLHDRYHFWCKCPKCSPTLDRKYTRGPKYIVGFVVLSVLLQLLVFYQRSAKNAVDQDFARLATMSEEERLAELRARGIVPDESPNEPSKKRSESRKGFFEWMEEKRLDKYYEPDGRGYMNIVNQMDPMTKPPR